MRKCCKSSSFFFKGYLHLFFFVNILGSSIKNPYSINSSYSTLAPWMGKDVRIGDVLPKTEVKKGLQKRQGTSRPATNKVDEDRILVLLDSKNVSVSYYVKKRS